MAGGLGLAPLRPAIYGCSPTAARYGQVVILLRQRAARTTYCIVTRSKQWRRRLDIDIEVTVDHADADWRGNVGVVTKLDSARRLRSA